MTAEDSNYKFSRIGFNCMSLDSSHNMIMMASLMDEDDVIVAISHSGETDEIIKTVNIAKANGASVISVTEDKSSRLRDVSDVNLGHSGETDEIIKTVNIAKANGASVISVTEDKSSRLRDVSDVNLGYFSGESILETGSISSKLAQFFIIDLVYTQVVKEKSAEVVERKIKTTDAIKLYNE